MIVRLVLLVALAVAFVTGRGSAADAVIDDPTAVVEALEGSDGEPMDDAVSIELAGVPAASYQQILLVLQGTEEEYASPEPARVFRPPRASFA